MESFEGVKQKFDIRDVHHIELYAADATSTSHWLRSALGMALVAKADVTTGCDVCASVAVKSEDVVLVVTAPQEPPEDVAERRCPLPNYDPDTAFAFIKTHGVAVRSIGLAVGDAREAYAVSTANGAIGVLEPVELFDAATGTSTTVAEIRAYKEQGDTVIRFVSGDFAGPFLPGYEAAPGSPRSAAQSVGILRIDHVNGDSNDFMPALQYLSDALGLHVITGLKADPTHASKYDHDMNTNFCSLASDDGKVILSMTEPRRGAAVPSPLQTFIDHNHGTGVHHLALVPRDIFATVRAMRAMGADGLAFMPHPPAAYYDGMKERVGDRLTEEQIAQCRELGILADTGDPRMQSANGLILQIFTTAIADRPTLVLEIIQRFGCESEVVRVRDDTGVVERVTVQEAGCGGFGKNNVREIYDLMVRHDTQFRAVESH